MKFAFIEQHASNRPVNVMCRMLGVSRSGYHDWHVRAPSACDSEPSIVARRSPTSGAAPGALRLLEDSSTSVGGAYKPRRDKALFGYVEGYYNRHRRHSAIGYLTPEQAEQRMTG